MTNYIGRFAPSPSGPLHFGSAVAALASYLQARSQSGRWIVRIEDIDPPREQPGASDAILNTLTTLGLLWDAEVTYQSQRSRTYDDALERLHAARLTFACCCTRKELAGGPYPGTCRDGHDAAKSARTLRVRIGHGEIAFDDLIQGRVSLNRQSIGDFVLRRADGLYAYHLAVVVDDAASGVTEVVRGVDLVESTTQQIFLQNVLGYPTPRYAHVPIVLDEFGAKLSKQTFAAPIDAMRPSSVLFNALTFLGQNPLVELVDASPEEILDWAVRNWQIRLVAKQSKAS
ncbi:MAG: tRNA glutamyl-Q(34) synthetase GluQRS [Proteobacteria bacterium]|nr:tRNA glutamyl-Q(34) synthetase GluQRS [Pseudomonadota bacterium]